MGEERRPAELVPHQRHRVPRSQCRGEAEEGGERAVDPQGARTRKVEFREPRRAGERASTGTDANQLHLRTFSRRWHSRRPRPCGRVLRLFSAENQGLQRRHRREHRRRYRVEAAKREAEAHRPRQHGERRREAAVGAPPEAEKPIRVLRRKSKVSSERSWRISDATERRRHLGRRRRRRDVIRRSADGKSPSATPSLFPMRSNLVNLRRRVLFLFFFFSLSYFKVILQSKPASAASAPASPLHSPLPSLLPLPSSHSLQAPPRPEPPPRACGGRCPTPLLR